MAGLKTLLSKPALRTLLFITMVWVFYLTRTRQAEPIQNINLDGFCGFMAAGKSGVIVLDMYESNNYPYQTCGYQDQSIGTSYRLRDNPALIVDYKTGGTAHAILVNDDRVFVANDAKGLLILSKAKLLESQSPEFDDQESIKLEEYQTPGKALDLAIKGKYAYIVDSSKKIVIVNIKDSEIDPDKAIFQEGVPGKPEKIRIFEDYVYITNDDQLLRYKLDDPEKLESPITFEVGHKVENFLVDRNHAYLALGSGGLKVLDVHSATEIIEVGKFENINALDVSVKGQYAFVAGGNQGFYVFSIKDLANIIPVGHEQSLNKANLIFGIEDYVYVANGRDGIKTFYSPVIFVYSEQSDTIEQGKYQDVVIDEKIAYIAAGEVGLQVINVAEPSVPVNKYYFDEQVRDDQATAVEISGEMLYVTYREQGLKAFYLSEARENPAYSDIEFSTEGEANDVMVSKDWAFIAIGSKGLQICDLKNENIMSAECFSEDTPGNALGVFVLDDYAYIADDDQGLQIMQVSDPEKPTLKGKIATRGRATSVFVAKMKNPANQERIYAFVADGDRGLFIADVTDPNRPEQVAVLDVGAQANDIKGIGQRIYLSDQADGFVVVDVSTITNPKLLGNHPTPGNAIGLFISDKLSYLADDEHGLRIINFEDETKPQEIGIYDLPKNVEQLVIADTYGYMVDGGSGMWVLNLTTNLPFSVAFLATPGNAQDIAIEESYAFIADGPSGVGIVDISNPQAPVLKSSYAAVDNAVAIAVDGDTIYVGSRNNKMYILNASDKENIEEIATFDTTERPLDIQVYDGYAYISEGEKGLEIVYIKEPDKITSYLANQDLGLTDTYSIEILKSQNHIMVADGKNGMKVFGINRPFAPRLVYEFPLEGDGPANSISASGEYAFLSAGAQGIFTFYIWDLSRIANVGHEPLEQAGVIAARSSLDLDDAKEGEKDKKAKDGLKVLNNRYYNYIFAGDGGLKTYQINGQAAIEKIGEYESVGEATLSQTFRQLLDALAKRDTSLIQEKVRTRLIYISFGGLTFFFVTTLWLVLFAQFVLPVQTVRDGKSAIARLFYSLWGWHGPAVFVKEGSIIGKPKEAEKVGPGVVRVDLSSAVVLERRFPAKRKWRKEYNELLKEERTKGRILSRARTEGPGVVFTEPYEVVRGSADLRPQFRIRVDVKAYTRDGIEFSNPVWVVYTLGQPPEVLDVAYDGDREAKNLKVVRFEDKKTTPDENIEEDKKKAKVVQFSDQLDPEDQNEIHRFVQTLAVDQYFSRVNKLAHELDPAQGENGIKLFLGNIEKLAENLGISTKPEVEQFLINCKSFVAIDPIRDESSVFWFIHQTLRASAGLGIHRSAALADVIYLSEINKYQIGLQAIQETLELQDDEFPTRLLQQKEKLLSSVVQDDPARNFIFNAIGFRKFSKEQLAQVMENLEDGPVGQVLRERWENFLLLLDRVTKNLIEGKYPSVEAYAAIARLQACFVEAAEMSPLTGIQWEWITPHIFKLYSIRWLVTKIQKRLSQLAALGSPELGRYADFIQLYYFHRYVWASMEEMQRNLVVPIENISEEQASQINSGLMRACIHKIKLYAPLLNAVQHKAYKRPVQKLMSLFDNLNLKEPLSVYDFSRSEKVIWRRLEIADQLAVRRYFRKSKKFLDEIQSNTYRLETAIKSSNGNEEITKYSIWIQKVARKLKECGIFDKSTGIEPRNRSQIGPFLFDRERVLASVYSEALNVDQFAGEADHIPWTDLPSHVAVQIYRDMVSKEQYDYLYEPNDPQKFNMPKLKGNLSRAVRNQGVLAFRFIEKADAASLKKDTELLLGDLCYYQKRDLTNPKVLRARGIKIIAAGFPDLFPVHSKVTGQLLDYWRSPWERKATEMRSQGELQAVRVINQARAQAQRDTAHTLAHILQSSRSDEALATRVFQALEAIAVNTDNRQFLPRDTMYLLRSFKHWFLPDGESDDDNEAQGGRDLPGSDFPYIEG